MHLSGSVSRQRGQVTVMAIEEKMIDHEEGFKALFKGGPARIIRSSPQFGFTLVAYEYLHKVSSCAKRNNVCMIVISTLCTVPREDATCKSN
jgi:hypothetical protein